MMRSLYGPPMKPSVCQRTTVPLTGEVAVAGAGSDTCARVATPPMALDVNVAVKGLPTITLAACAPDAG